MFLSLVVSQSLNSRHKAVNPIRILNVPLGLAHEDEQQCWNYGAGFESKRAAATARPVFVAWRALPGGARATD